MAPSSEHGQHVKWQTAIGKAVVADGRRALCPAQTRAVLMERRAAVQQHGHRDRSPPERCCQRHGAPAPVGGCSGSGSRAFSCFLQSKKKRRKKKSECK